MFKWLFILTGVNLYKIRMNIVTLAVVKVMN